MKQHFTQTTAYNLIISTLWVRFEFDFHWFSSKQAGQLIFNLLPESISLHGHKFICSAVTTYEKTECTSQSATSAVMKYGVTLIRKKHTTHRHHRIPNYISGVNALTVEVDHGSLKIRKPSEIDKTFYFLIWALDTRIHNKYHDEK